MNGGLISGECSHGLIQHFPLIARVHTRANVNKMGTELKRSMSRRSLLGSEMRKRRPVVTLKVVDLGSSASTPPFVWSFPIILYACKVVNAISDAFSLLLEPV